MDEITVTLTTEQWALVQGSLNQSIEYHEDEPDYPALRPEWYPDGTVQDLEQILATINTAIPEQKD